MYLNLIVIKLVTNVSMKGRLHHITNVAVAFFVRIIIFCSFIYKQARQKGAHLLSPVSSCAADVHGQHANL